MLRTRDEQLEGMLHEANEVEAILAKALGYPYDKDYGWVTGEHTSVTLAMEAYHKITGERINLDEMRVY